jgi:hypothetical protein
MTRRRPRQLLLVLIGQPDPYSQSNWTVGDLIAPAHEALLLRPCSPSTTPGRRGGRQGGYLTLIVPLTALLGLILRPQVPWTWGSAAAFVPALALAWALRFAWGYALALLAFWATRADALLAVQDTLVFLLAGQVAPLALLPAAMQTAARALPFRYMLGFPVEVLNGQLAAGEIAQGFLVGGGWLAFSVAPPRCSGLGLAATPLWEGDAMYVVRLVGQFIGLVPGRDRLRPISTWPCSIRCWAWRRLLGIAVVYGQRAEVGAGPSGALAVLASTWRPGPEEPVHRAGLDSLAGLDG